MVSSGLNLTGNVSLNAESAIRAAATLAQRFQSISQNARASSATIKNNADAMLAAAKAASTERDSLVGLASAQARINALQKESASKVAVNAARAGAIDSGAADKTNLANTRAQIALDESEVKVINSQAVAEARVNTERERGVQIAGRTNNEAAVAQGRVALTEARQQTEAVRQRIALEQQEGRTQLNNARVSESAIRSQIAQQKLLLQQEAAASSAGARIANQQRESLAVTRGALGSLGASFTRLGVLGGAAFIGLAANAVIMDREFVNVVRTSDIIDENLKQLNANGFKSQSEAIASLKLQFDALAQSLPLSYNELTKIGTAANQLGIATPNLAAFVNTVAKFSTVTGVSVDTAATAFGRLDSLIVDTGGRINGVDHDYQGLADSINKVGVNSVATDQQIINMSAQIAGVSNAAGLGYKDIVGFSGALASVSISPYLARGLTTRLFTNIGNAVKDGGTELQKFANVAHESATQFSDDWNNNPREAILKLFAGIHDSGSDAVNVLKSLGVNSVLDQPALIRLANAADSTGKAGALLAQTFRDANDAVGENAKQFAKVSDTVQAHLQIALNRVQILLRNIGEANMGPLGLAIDSLSNGALQLSQNLDKPFKLFGIFPNLFNATNGAAIGLGVSILGVVSVLALLAGAGAKVGSGLIALRQAYLGIRTFMGGNSFKGVASSSVEAAGAIDAQTAAVGRLAAAEREEAATRAGAMLSSNAVTAESSAFGDASLLARATATAKSSILTSNNAIVKSMVSLGSTGGAALRGAVSGAKALGGALSDVAFSLPGLAIAGTVAGMVALDGAMRNVGTTAGSMAVVLAKSSSAIDILKNTSVSAATDGIAATWDKTTKSFMSNTTLFKSSLASLGQGGLLNDFAAKFTSVFSEGKLNAGFNATTLGLDKIDAGLKQLNDGGQTDAAVKSIQTLFKGASDTEIVNALAHMGNATSILTSKLNTAGKTAGENNKNVLALAKGNQILATQTDLAGNATSTLANAFTDNATQVNDYIASIKTLGDATVDLNKQFSAVPKGSKNPYADFVKGTEDSFAQYTKDQENILRVSKDTGISLKDLGSLDPGILDGALKGGKKAEAELVKIFNLKDARQALDQAMGELGSDPKLLSAFTGLGTSTQDAIAKSLSEGASIPDAFAAAGPKAIAAFNAAVKGTAIPPIDIHAKINENDLAASLKNLSSLQAKKLSVQILGDAAPAVKAGESAVEIINALRAAIITDANTVIAQKKGESTAAYLSRLKATLTVLGDTSNVTKKGQDAATQVGELQAKILIDADTSRVHQSADDVKGEINKIVTTMSIHGISVPARKEGESAAEYIARLHATLTIAADAAAAKLKGQSAADQISGLKALITITGEDAPAQRKGESAKAYIERLRAFLHVSADTSDAQKKAAQAAHTISGLKSQFAIHGNTAPARKEGESVQAYITRLKGILKIDADKTLAQGKADAVSHYASSRHPVMPINGNNALARAKANDASVFASSRRPVMKISGNNADAFAKANAAKAHADALTAHLRVSADASAANAAINYAARNRTTFVTLVQQGTISAQAGKNAAQFNALGGPISGPGTGTSDSILSYLSNGEYVIRAQQAKKYRALLDQINYGIAGYATGGVVTGGSARYAGSAASVNSSLAASLSNVTQITELSPYDRHLLTTIANNIGVSIEPAYIAGANTSTNRTQARRGNG